MQLKEFTATRKEALTKWHEYRAAEKVSGNPLYKDLKKLYNQIKSGRKIIDIAEVIKAGGLHPNYHPKLAIAQASTKVVFCRYDEGGNIIFKNSDNWRTKKNTIELKNCLPKIPRGLLPKVTWSNDGHGSHFDLKAPVPLIPPKHLPVNLTDDYFILWEVDEWRMIPPTDPYLLRRITNNHFVVVAGWDLTELEKSVMGARL